MRNDFMQGFKAREMYDYTISVTGTVTFMLSGTYAGTFMLKANPDNSGVIYISDREDGNGSMPYGAGETTGWVPEAMVMLYYWGETAGDRVHIWISK